jgi:DMSO/TMAO reductase YedYZ molybdopterin-dependent catalytic subunit
MDRITRRAFLKVAGVGGLLLAAGCRPELPASLASATSAEPTAGGTTLPPLPPAPTEILITPTGQLFAQSYAAIPSIDLAAWQLVVDGLVEHPLTLSDADLQAFPRVQTARTLECIGNPVGGSLIGTPVWGGFEAALLWEQARILPEAVQAKFTGADGYQTSVDLEWITQPGVLMADEVNGRPLPPAHGFPLRILMPGLYGQKMPKWITHIEFIGEQFLGFWETQGWSDVASVKTNSIVRQPVEGEIPAGATPVFGVAFAGLRRIRLVEVRIDDGEWMPAELLQDESPWVWTQWSFSWDAAPGRHSIAVRATDESGYTQSTEGDSSLASPFPAGTAGIDQSIVAVVPR